MKKQISLEGYPFTEEDLRQVCAIYVEQLCKIEGTLDFEPSQAHQEAIQKIMDDALKQGKRRAAFRRIAAAVAVVLLIGSMAFVTNVSAREHLENWVRRILTNNELYEFFGDAPDNVHEYAIGWLPDGFDLFDEHGDKYRKFYGYANGDGQIYISIESIHQGLQVEIGDTDFTTSTVIINGISATLYVDLDGKSNNLVWVDPEYNMFIEIQSTVDPEIMIRIAESFY